jgi:hypothetical protein
VFEKKNAGVFQTLTGDLPIFPETIDEMVEQFQALFARRVHDRNTRFACESFGCGPKFDRAFSERIE